MLYRLLYRSDMRLDCPGGQTDGEIETIVSRASQTNAKMGLSGALVCTRGVFIQVLEGPLAAVEIVFEKICCDMRHSDLKLIEFVSADGRLFGDWSMVRLDGSASNGAGSSAKLHADIDPRDDISPDEIVRRMRTALSIPTNS